MIVSQHSSAHFAAVQGAASDIFCRLDSTLYKMQVWCPPQFPITTKLRTKIDLCLAFIYTPYLACKCAAFQSAGSVRDCKWWEVRVGMLLEVRDGEDFPADLLCLHCASAHHVCYVKTTNLDGARLLA